MEVKGTKINLKRKRCLLTPLLAVSPTAEGLAILLLVFITGVILPGFGRWRGRAMTAFGILGRTLL